MRIDSAARRAWVPCIAVLALASMPLKNQCHASAPDSTEAISQPPPLIDSLVWQNPAVEKFLLETLGDSQKVDYADIRFSKSEAFGKTYESAYSPSGPDDKEWVLSPDGIRGASVMNYWGGPDNSLEVCNWRGDGRTHVMLFCGTACKFLGVHWLDNDRFVFVLTHVYWDGPGAYALIKLYDLAVDSTWTYESPRLRTQR